MYVVIRKFSAMRSVPEAARRAESGIGQILKQSPGSVAYYVFDGGNGVGGSVTLFEDRGKANAANEKALAWIRGSQDFFAYAAVSVAMAAKAFRGCCGDCGP